MAETKTASPCPAHSGRRMTGRMVRRMLLVAVLLAVLFVAIFVVFAIGYGVPHHLIYVPAHG